VSAAPSNDAVFAVLVGVAKQLDEQPRVDDGRIWFEGPRTSWLPLLEYRAAVSAVAGFISVGEPEAAADALATHEAGVMRDRIATEAVTTLAAGLLWSAELPAVDELQAGLRRFLAVVRDRDLLTAPRLVLDGGESS
jgi:hypothetical protein